VVSGAFTVVGDGVIGSQTVTDIVVLDIEHLLEIRESIVIFSNLQHRMQ
jgi:hypothetical protein